MIAVSVGRCFFLSLAADTLDEEKTQRLLVMIVNYISLHICIRKLFYSVIGFLICLKQQSCVVYNI